MAWIVADGWGIGYAIFNDGWMASGVSYEGTQYVGMGNIPKIYLQKRTTGPLVFKNDGNSFYGRYILDLVAMSGSYPIEGDWIFYAEHPILDSSGVTLFHQHFGEFDIVKSADQFGYIGVEIIMSGDHFSSMFSDNTGTSGGYIGMWGVHDNWVTTYEKIPYRVVNVN